MNKELIKQFIKNLLDERDFLCYQLTEAKGLINSDTFKRIENAHFDKFSEKSQNQINLEVEELLKLTGKENMSVDNIYVILKCSIDKAELALKHLFNLWLI